MLSTTAGLHRDMILSRSRQSEILEDMKAQHHPAEVPARELWQGRALKYRPVRG